MRSIARQLAVVVAGAAVATGVAAPSSAHAGYLVFSKGPDIWLARDDGSAAKVLVTAASLHEARLQKPAVAPGTDAIAFESWNTDSTRVYAWEAGAARKVGDGWASGSILGGAGASSNDPDVAADRRVIFQSDAVVVTAGCDLWGCGTDGTSSSGLVSVLSTGEDKRALPARCDSARDPAANPANPAQFAYVGCWIDLDPNDPWNPISYALRVTDGQSDRMVSYDDQVQLDPAWSLDGTRIVTSEQGTEPGIWVYASDGSGGRLAVVPQPGATPFQSPRFMGDRIIFAKNGDVWSVAAGCDHCVFPNQATQVTRLGGVGEVAWTSASGFRTQAEQPPPPPLIRSGPALRLTAMKVAPSTFRPLRSGSSVVRARGARVTFTLSEPARVTFRVRDGRGATLRGAFSITGRSGRNQIWFSGRLDRRTLAPGRYRLVARAATPDARTSAVVSVTFRTRR